MLTEVDIPNADQAIIPGSFVDVTIDVKVPPVRRSRPKPW